MTVTKAIHRNALAVNETGFVAPAAGSYGD